ncbi:unnamed protein product [Schistocephalus solidus]|uniref:RING-CH-type domain-containing protein n=2 Tax=Schistocephalus solidus TaxID=70667 RepID=A0A183T5A5_SCHSO|nr:unnamed protein product [Schistocephalus solidus]
MTSSPVNGRKYSHGATRFQQAPGAPKINHNKQTSISGFYQPEEFLHSAGGKRWRERFDSESSVAERAFDTALIGAPRLNLSQSTTSGETTSDLDTSTTNGLLESSPLFKSATASTPGPGVKLPKKSIAFNAESPIANVTQTEEAALDRIQNISSSTNRPSIVVFRCRICYEEGTDSEPLISPCHCRGTVGLLHKTCLEKWLQLSQTLKCEICGYAYILRPKPVEITTSKVSATQIIERVEFLRDWFHSRLVQRNLATDLVFLLLLTPATCLGVYFCITAMLDFMKVNSYAWQVIVLMALAITLVVVLFCWILLAVRHHLLAYREHRHRREARIREELRRQSVERRWRFSVQARPRGSSVALRSSTPQAKTARREESEEGEADSSLRDPPQCTLINVTSPNFTLNLYPVQETTETMADTSQEDSTEQDGSQPVSTMPV